MVWERAGRVGHVLRVPYNVAEAGFGIGSLFFCALLFRTGLVPRFLAVWGFIGYACFAGGNLLELFGVAGAALVSSIPGGYPNEGPIGVESSTCTVSRSS